MLKKLKQKLADRTLAAEKIYAERAKQEKEAMALMRTLTPGHRDAVATMRRINELLSK